MKPGQKIDEMANRRPEWEAGQWVFVYDDRSNIAWGGDKALQAAASTAQGSMAWSVKLAHCSTGPYKILFVGPEVTAEGEEVGNNLF